MNIVLGLLLAAADPSGSASSAPVPVPAPSTVQQQFDAASAAYEAEKWPDALTAFNALEARLSNKNHRSLLVVRLLKGITLMHLNRYDEAVPIIDGALRELPVNDPSLNTDRYSGWITLGQIHELQFDYDAAVDSYEHAAAIPMENATSAMIGAARVQAFLDPPKAIANVDRAIATETAQSKPNKETIGQLRTIRGRALLNDRQYGAAKRELLKAVEELGGLSTRVNLADIAARSDLAIAALLNRDDADAKKYLAYSGSGNLEDGFAGGVDMNPPACGEETGLQPDDVAVVEFGINANGTVSYAHPVYVSRPGPTTAAFAKATSEWSWSPGQLAKIPPFFRLMTRLELRCSNARSRPTIAVLMDRAIARWLSDRHVPVPKLTGVEATDIVALRAELARLAARSDGEPLAQAPVLLFISRNAVAGSAERAAAAVALRKVVLGQNPPAMVLAAASVRVMLDYAPDGSKRRREAEIQSAEPLLSDPVIAADAEAVNALRIRLADAYLEILRNDRAAPLIDAVIADKRLTDRNAFHVGALVRRSSIALAKGDLQTARSAYDATGLSDAQCALVDASPVVVKRSGGASDYPKEAITWGISGWVVNEFDISADGTTANIRTIAAYPPFVFGKPNEQILQRTRFQQSYRPQGGLGCSSKQSRQGFRVIR